MGDVSPPAIHIISILCLAVCLPFSSSFFRVTNQYLSQSRTFCTNSYASAIDVTHLCTNSYAFAIYVNPYHGNPRDLRILPIGTQVLPSSQISPSVFQFLTSYNVFTFLLSAKTPLEFSTQCLSSIRHCGPFSVQVPPPDKLSFIDPHLVCFVLQLSYISILVPVIISFHFSFISFPFFSQPFSHISVLHMFVSVLV